VGGAPNEREEARKHLRKLLQELKKTEGDLPGLMAELAQVEAEETAEKADDDFRRKAEAANDPRATHPRGAETTQKARDIPCLELVDFFLREFLSLQEHEYVVMALWILHTHVFGQFLCTPRLTFVSPAPDCGKTTALALLERLTFKADRSDSATPASLYRLLDEHGPRTLLLDEMDNAELMHNAELRRFINSGHRQGGVMRRFIGGRTKRFLIFAPVALAAIATNRPFPSAIISRSIVIKMQRSRRRLRRVQAADISDLTAVHDQIRFWVFRKPKLNLDPPLPPKLRTRPRDNWTPLVSIADAFGPTWGESARNALVLFKTGREEDRGILALEDIREVFTMHGLDRFSSPALVGALRELEDAGWDDLGLTASKLRALLEPFGLKPKTIWPAHRTEKSRSMTGYLRAWFEDAWDQYCSGDDDEAPSSSNVRQLRG
jgi:Protein of unknown function (DUF3631)